ncbi:MAG: cation transporter [Psychrobium sp.]|nr:cation transporter [Psychrobium sp.]
MFTGTFLSSTALAHQLVTTQNVVQQNVTFSIAHITCKMCIITVRKAMENVDGVIKAKVDYKNKVAQVIFKPSKTSVKEIALASTNAGSPATFSAIAH